MQRGVSLERLWIFFETLAQGRFLIDGRALFGNPKVRKLFFPYFGISAGQLEQASLC